MRTIWFISDGITYGFWLYSIALLSSYLFVGIFAILEMRQYMRLRSFTDYSLLASSPYVPGISILAPAYNEAASIVENVRSLLSIHYRNLELIVINDGSKDDSLQRLIGHYQLVRTDHFTEAAIPAKPIRGIYRSRNPVFHKLIVVDKENGGKADALNVGINVSSKPYIVCIDVDCIIEQDALLKMARPFLDSGDERVIASGGVVRIANGCEIRNGRLVKVHLPESFLPRAQTLEYFRAFLLGRMAWSRLNALLLISGAFGAFDKEIVVACGGYNHATVGEDMELVVRMRRYMEERRLPYKVTYIPDPLCWTEAPASYKILGRQRNRWTRGTIETLSMHRKMCFNPRYGRLGLLSFPYWLFFELFAPIVEFLGLAASVVIYLFGGLNLVSFLTLLGFILSFGILFSVLAILMEVLTFNQYKDSRDILRLVLTALLEPFLFHPFIVWSAIRGNIDLLRKKKGWGEMSRQGFTANKAKVYAKS